MTSEPLALPGAAAPSPDLERRLRAGLLCQGPSYVPRTHHLDPAGAPRFLNRLILETSPYLLQHAHNPVDWYPWGEEAFATARRLDRPIFLSVGYSTCHWCHVMERESFEDLEIAAFLNAHYVAIKVDREERPDVDGVYMAAVQLLTGRGGWPMTVVMAADGRPFFGGTYFPARDGDRGIGVGFLTALRRLHQAWIGDRAQVDRAAERLASSLRESQAPRPAAGAPGPEALARAAQALAKHFDPYYGGFGHAPKFPRPSTYELLLRHHRRTGDPGALHMVTHSLDHMTAGGIYDHVGGGFARYSTDEVWLVPHFEKMLYDNAQLAALLVEAYQSSGEPRYAAVARETLDYVLREMTSPSGGFYSATDADSEGEEGRFFVWTLAELEAELGPERAELVAEHFGVTARGNFERRNVLHVAKPLARLAQERGLPLQQLEVLLREAKAALYAARERRPHPLLDDKILTEWNGQMIGAMARAGFVLDEPRYLEAARRAAGFVLEHLARGDRLARAHRAGESRHAGVLEDYAFSIAGLLELFEATGELRWLQSALTFQRAVDDHFWDPAGGGYFATADDAEALLLREKPLYDGAQPSGSSVAALNLLRLAELTGEDAHRARAAAILGLFGEVLGRGAAECPKLAQALDFHLDRPKQVVLVTTERDPGAPLLDVLRRTFSPNQVSILAREGELPALARALPLLEGKVALDGRATAYVCETGTCQRPTTSPAELEAQLQEVVRLSAAPLAVLRR